MALQNIEVIADQFSTRIEKLNRSQAVRGYQQDAINAIKAAWQENKSALIACATGTGKTTIIADLLHQIYHPDTERVLLLAAQREIIDQLFERVDNQVSQLKPAYHENTPQACKGLGIVMANQNDYNARIVVATRQSLHKLRLEKCLSIAKFDYLIIDEADQVSPDNNYHRITKALKAANPNLKILGVTATPERSDGLALKSVFDEIVYEYPIVTAISDGWLVPVIRQVVETDINLNKYKIANRHGDYAENDLVAALDENNWPERAADAYMQHLHTTDRVTMAFFPSVNQSKKFVEILNSLGVHAEHLDGTTNNIERQGIIRRLRSGETKVVSNCMVLTRGFDAPIVSAILMARPTKSRTLFTQIIGRALRPYPGKQNCLLVDLTVVDTKVISTGTLLGKTLVCPECHTEYLKPARIMPCPNCGAMPQEEKKSLETGNGLPDTDKHSKKNYVGTIFEDLSGYWHKGEQEIYTLSLGFERQRDGKTKSFGGLVIYPPSLDDISELKSRLEAGMSVVDTAKDDNQKYRYIQKIKHLQRMIARCDSYCLYHVDGKGTVEYLKANRDLQSLIIEADRESIRKSGKAIAKQGISRDASWRENEISDSQKNLARQLGIQVDGLSRGEVSALINHAKTTPNVAKWIQEDQV